MWYQEVCHFQIYYFGKKVVLLQALNTKLEAHNGQKCFCMYQKDPSAQSELHEDLVAKVEVEELKWPAHSPDHNLTEHL